MTVYTFVANPTENFVEWSDPTVWAGGVAPDDPTADVVIPTITQTSNGEVYASNIIIDANTTISVNSVSIANNYLAVDGNLDVAHALNVLTSGEIDMDGANISAGTVVNDGTDVQGTGQITCGGVFINNTSLGAIGPGITGSTGGLIINAEGFTNLGDIGNLTLTVPEGGFTNLSNGTLTGGAYGGGDFNVGGVVTTDDANISLAGQSDMAFFDDSTGAYVPLLSTLQSIGSSGQLSLSSGDANVLPTFEVNQLAISGSLSVSNAVLDATQLTVDAGGQIVGAEGKIVGPIVDDGLVLAQADTSGTALLDLNGAVAGVGVLEIAAGAPAIQQFPATNESIATLELGGADSSLVQFGNNIGTLQLDDPAGFTGQIEPGGSGDQVVLPGVSLGSVVSYAYAGDSTGGTLTINDGGATPITLNFIGDYDTASFSLTAGPQPLSTSPPSLVITVGASATDATLTAAFTNVLIGAPNSAFATSPTITLADGSTVPNPMYQDAQTLPTLVSDVANGQITLAQAMNTIEHYGDATTSVATVAYQFFTGATPNASGYAYLVNGTVNPNDLNDPFYAKFTEPDRYIDFAVNLGKYGAGAASFSAAYGSLDLTDAVTQAYTAIFGFAPAAGKITSILDAVVGPNGETRADYFALFGGDGLDGIGTKAAAVGWLMEVAVQNDLGVYAAANDDLLAALANGTGQYNVDLLTTYPIMTAAQAAAMEGWGVSNITHPLIVADTGVNVAANLDALQALAAGNELTSISLTDPSAPTLAIAGAQLTADTQALADISGPYNLSVAGVAAANAAAAQGDSHVVSFSVTDTAADISSALDALQADGKLDGISLTDSSPVSINASQLFSGARALSDITGSPALSVTGTSVQFNGATVAHFTASGSELDVTDLNSAALSASFVEASDGSGGQLSLSDGVHSITVTLVGQIAADNFSGAASSAGFVFASNGSGGTDITWHG